MQLQWHMLAAAVHPSVHRTHTHPCTRSSCSLFPCAVLSLLGCAPSGVKYLHHEAKEFDIGIYFESNGHGTVLFKPSLLQRLQDMDEQVSWQQ